MRRLLAALFLALAAPVAAQPVEPEWRDAREEPVFVRVGRFEPDVLRLEAGRPTRIVFRNGSRSRLSISAGDLLARARVHPRDMSGIEDGSFTLAPGESRSITLVAAAGNYAIGSGSWLRRLMGMRAQVIVESPQRTSGEEVD